MAKAPYPVVPVAGEQDWRDRHPKAKIWIGALVAFVIPALFGIGAILLVEYSFRHHPVTEQAIARAQTNPRVVQMLGEPLKIGHLIKGTIHIKDGDGYADLKIPIFGTKGRGTLVLYAREISGAWQFISLHAEIDGASESINLLGPSGGINLPN